MRRLPCVLLAALLLSPVAAAYPDPDKAPRYYDSDCFAKYDRRFVHDYVGALDPEMALQMEGAACEVYAQTGAHFVFVGAKDTEGEPLEPYALHLFEKWGIGDKDRLDGLLLLYVKDYQRDGKPSAVRIEVGYGLTGVIDGIVAADVIDAMRDAKQRGLDGGETEAEATSYALGLGALVLLQVLSDQYVDGRFPEPARDPLSLARQVPTWVWVVAILVVIVLVAGLSRSAGRSRSGWGYYPGSPAWSSGLGSRFGGGGFGGGGFGGGGGGFGGGRSGGGGGSGGF